MESQQIGKNSIAVNGVTTDRKKIPPIGREWVYNENSDFRVKKTNRMEKKHEVY
jgi:hypothetical protein